jgi:biopolymer transport protein TolR
MSGFRPAVKKKLKADINVVPLIDVMLVLLIVFMITAPMMTQGIKVELPKAASEPVDTKEDQPITVSVKADGSYYIDLAGDPETARPLAEIKSIVRKVLAEKPNTLVIVKLMGELKLAGAPSVGLITEPGR